MPQESTIQVAPDGTGKKVRNLQITTLDSVGNSQTVQMQVVNIADLNGNLVAFDFGLQLAAMSVQLDRITQLLSQIANQAFYA